MAPFEGTWQGDIITKWDHGSPPGFFKIKIELSPPNLESDDGQQGHVEARVGWSRGQKFTLTNGRFDLTKKTFKFDMIFNGHPPEEFSGRLHGSVPDNNFTSITGNIRVKPAWYQNKPLATRNLYGAYWAKVTLYYKA